MKTNVFKSPAARDAVRAYYNRVLSRFPFGQRYAETAFGQTFMLTAGSEANPPVILLHGSCSNSAFWFPEMMALSQNYRVYAVDIIGEAGNSEEYRPDLRSDAFALWMKDVLDALGLDKAVFVGNSLGGWMALKFASAYPQRAAGLILIASAGLAPIRPEFLHSARQRQTEAPPPIDPSVIGGAGIPKEVLEFMNLIIESYNPIPDLPVFTDAELRRLAMPVLFIGGEKDALIDAKESALRLSRLVPSAEIQLLPDCGHMVSNAVAYIGAFLMKGLPAV